MTEGRRSATDPKLEIFPRGACPVVYGPVPSRRHGRSLGINLGDPVEKKCTWSCLYCQCGFGRSQVPASELAFVSADYVLREVVPFLDREQGRLDSITMAGNSEPASNPAFPEIVDRLLELREKRRERWILNVLSNGSELESAAVREACDRLDEAWVKLDCAEESLFQRLNRPDDKVGRIHDHLRRLGLLRNLRIQTLLWRDSSGRGLSNDTDENRAALLSELTRLSPREIHLTTIQREPAAAFLSPVPAPDLERFAMELRDRGLSVRVFSAS